MDSVQIGTMLELSKEEHTKLGEILILEVHEDGTGSPFANFDYVTDDDGGIHITQTEIRLSKKSAKKLALELLKFAEEEESNENNVSQGT